MGVSFAGTGLSRWQVEPIVRAALAEDLGAGDITTCSVVPADLVARATLVAREGGVVAGLPVAHLVFSLVDETIDFQPLVGEGAGVSPDGPIVRLVGPARGILSGERVALNFLQRLSGIATRTARMVAMVKDYPVRITDTRKTTPGLRVLEKYAVRVGGGVNHRFSLSDAVLIKDNHIAAAGGILPAVERARRRLGPAVKIEVEAQTPQQVEEALQAGAELIMLDNMALGLVRAMVALVNGRARLEASGGITEENLLEVARTGVDYISVGALTHSPRALDISLEMETT